jgi:hypothetical protein
MSKKLDELRERFAAHKEALERWSQWCPNRPWPKQRAFMALDELEALYGGAAGGGKTDALLADALQYVDSGRLLGDLPPPNVPDLNLPDAPWTGATSGSTAPTRWNERDKQWTFPLPSGAGHTVQFGYCSESLADVQRYKSAAFHRIYIDELTEWERCGIHVSLLAHAAAEVWPRFRDPARDARATNPDGPGYGWVRKRFGIPENQPHRRAHPAREREPRIPPGARRGQSALDLAAYEKSLEQMVGGRGGVKWKQLREGFWIPDGAGLVYVFTRTSTRRQRCRGAANARDGTSSSASTTA